jgi:hypothetical protein
MTLKDIESGVFELLVNWLYEGLSIEMVHPELATILSNSAVLKKS